MTLHLIPTGLSIITNMPNSIATDLRGDPTGWLAAVNHDKLIEHIEDLKTRRKTGAPTAASYVSAEVASLKIVGAPGRRVFLASDTNVGLLAAHMNSLALTNQAPRVSQVVTTIPADPAVIVIKGLDPSSAMEFKEIGMANIAKLMATVAETTDNGEHVVFHLSGGFSATIPYLVLCAELLQSQFLADGRGCSVSAYMIWEESNTPVTINLRKLDLALLKGELSGENGHSDTFGNGYLYDGNVPTELGRAVAAFLKINRLRQ